MLSLQLVVVGQWERVLLTCQQAAEGEGAAGGGPAEEGTPAAEGAGAGQAPETEEVTMQLFMWQRDIVGVAHYVKDSFDVLGALSADAPDDASGSSSSALAAK